MVKYGHPRWARIGFVDLLFCWPPNGGADVDVYHVLSGLHRAGVDVKLFVLQLEGAPGRGQVDGGLPFDIEVVRVSRSAQQRGPILQAMKAAVAAWHPDAVFLSHGYALKPWLALTLRDYPLVGRYYAHEMMCARDSLRFKNNEPCPYNYMDDPDYCRRCAAASLGREIKTGVHQAWVQDYLLAGAYRASFYKTARQGVAVMDRVIVSNTSLQDEVRTHGGEAVVVPGGVDASPAAAAKAAAVPVPADKTVILVSGRVQDPAKGLDVLLEAGERLYAKRGDFHILATHQDPLWGGPFYSSTGWLSHEDARTLFDVTHICCVPSLWHEPFGLVAVEAMMAGLPVCAADCGGLRDIVRHEETGILFSRGDAAELARCLEQLLDNVALRAAMGRAGRERALTLYTWDRIIDTHYLPLIESVLK